MVTITVHAGSTSWDGRESRLINRNKIIRHKYYENPEKFLENESERNYTLMRHDIALVKLEAPFTPFLNDSEHYLINTICLPNATQTLNTDYESVQSFGFGLMGKDREARRLQTTEFRLFPYEDCPHEGLLCTFANEDDPKTCEVSYRYLNPDY